jgi:hypothetical protein
VGRQRVRLYFNNAWLSTRMFILIVIGAGLTLFQDCKPVLRGRARVPVMRPEVYMSHLASDLATRIIFWLVPDFATNEDILVGTL